MKKKIPDKIYMVQWNLGGFLHHKIYTLTCDRYKPHYYDKSGDVGGVTEEELKRYLDKEVDVRNLGCYRFYASSLETARLVLLGAKTTKEFLKLFVDGAN